MATTHQQILEKVKKKYPLPSMDESWKQLRADDEFFETAMEAVSAGHSVAQFARLVGIPGNRVSSWLSTLTDPVKVQAYEDARRARAQYMADKILDICDQVESGLITPQMARIIVDNMRWMAERLDPQIWGKKLEIKAEVKSTTEMHLEAVREMSRRIKSGDDRPVIEGEIAQTMDMGLLE